MSTEPRYIEPKRSFKSIELGKNYYNLTPIEKLENRGTAGHYYRCICKCGKEVVRQGASLNNGRASSCGCDHKSLKPIEIGETYGKLTVLESLPSEIISRGRRYRCMCSCGKEYIILSHSLKTQNNPSCGCNRIPPEPWKTSARVVFNNTYRDGNLSFDDFLTLSQQDCFYCGSKPSNVSNSNKRGPRRYLYAWTYQGLDRTNNLLPHNLENVVPCCKQCNFFKGSKSYDEFLSLIRRIYNHRAK